MILRLSEENEPSPIEGIRMGTPFFDDLHLFEGWLPKGLAFVDFA